MIDQLFADELPELVISEKVGFVGGDGVEEMRLLFLEALVALDEAIVLLEFRHIQRLESAPESIAEQPEFAILEMDARLVINELRDLLELSFCQLLKFHEWASFAS